MKFRLRLIKDWIGKERMSISLERPPFSHDIYTRQQQRISKLVIFVSGKFTENAIEKICARIESHSLRNNLVFIDGDKIEILAEKFRGIGAGEQRLAPDETKHG